MATSSILLLPESMIMPDGSASNLAPGMTRRKGTQTAPPAYYMTADFDAATKEVGYWRVVVPQDYVSGGTLRLFAQANATSNAAIISAAVSAVTPGDADTMLEHAFGAEATLTWTATTEARRLISGTITLTMDSAAVGDVIVIRLFRDGANGSDTLSVDWELVAAALEYTS
jgi:hypothetical protein